jgi:hypothetical protein
VSGLVFWVSGLVLWLPGLVLWLSGLAFYVEFTLKEIYFLRESGLVFRVPAFMSPVVSMCKEIDV